MCWRERDLTPGAKVFVRVLLPQLGAVGQHTALLQGNEIPATIDSSLVIAHFNQRSAWQAISKSVIGFFELLAAGQQEIAKQRNSHYRDL